MTLQSVYAPDFSLSLDGQPLPAELRASVMSVTFEEGLEGAGHVEVAFANPGLRYLEHPLFQLDAPVELSLGYLPGPLRHMFSGEVTGVEPSFPAGGMPTISISSHDFMHRFQEGRKDRTFPWYLPDALVASIASLENFLLPDPDPAAYAASALNMLNQRPRNQHKQSDYDLLRAIAAEYGFDMWVDGSVFHLRLSLPGLPPPDVELRWGESLLDFTPRHTSVGLAVSVTIKVWIAAIKTGLAVSASFDGDSMQVRVLPAFLDSSAKGASVDLPDIPMDTPVDAVKWVLAELRRRVNNRTTGRGSTLGNPAMRVGDVVSLQGLGPYSGSTYRLTSVSHTLDSNGYRTRFQVRKELI